MEPLIVIIVTARFCRGLDGYVLPVQNPDTVWEVPFIGELAGVIYPMVGIRWTLQIEKTTIILLSCSMCDFVHMFSLQSGMFIQHIGPTV